VQATASRLAEEAVVEQICNRCGKARPENSRAGSFTAYLFKELRCQCGDNFAATPKAKVASRTSTAHRATQRKRVRSKWLNSAASIANEQETVGPGSIVGKTFKILSVIGRGGMGIVYEAQHLSLKRPFALKILSPDLVSEPSWFRFQAEAKTMASLNHESFAKVYDLGIHNQSIPFYSMDLLQGHNLEDIIAERGPVDLSTALEIFLALPDGMVYAHRNGIIHRDLKPANIFLCSNNSRENKFEEGEIEVKILDLGISKLLN